MQLQQPLTQIDLDAYFQRIGYSGDCSPRLTTLQRIHQRHSQTIAFENLNSLLKQPVKLDLASLQQKLINEGRGGYCFEQNSLLRAVLLALGFEVTKHYLDGRTEHRVLSTVAELRATLESVFCLNLGAIADLDRMLQQLIERSCAMT